MFPTTAGTPAPFVVTWSSYLSSNNNFDILAESFNPNGSARAASFQVNEAAATLQPSLSPPTIGWQLMPDVSVDTQGHITIVWTSFGQDNAEIGNPSFLDYGIYARMYNEDGSNYFDPGLGTFPLEFRVNATTLGNQTAPAVASDNPSDNSIIAWVGPDTLAPNTTTAIYSRVIDPPGASPAKAPGSAIIAPAVTTNPVSQAATAGATVTFTAAASGSPAPNVQWQVSSNNGSTFTSIAGANSTSYTLTTAASENGYEYRAAFTNSMGTVDSIPATLEVGTPSVTANSVPVVKTNPASQAVNAGAAVTFTAAASGTPTPTVQWQSSTNGSTWVNIAGAISTSYGFTASSGMTGTMYRAVFTNSVGTAATSSAVLTVYCAAGHHNQPGEPVGCSGCTGSLYRGRLGFAHTHRAVAIQYQRNDVDQHFRGHLDQPPGRCERDDLRHAVPGCIRQQCGHGDDHRRQADGQRQRRAGGLAQSAQPDGDRRQVGNVHGRRHGAPAPTVQWQSSTNGTTWTNISGAIVHHLRSDCHDCNDRQPVSRRVQQRRRHGRHDCGRPDGQPGAVGADLEEQPCLRVGRGWSFGQLHCFGQRVADPDRAVAGEHEQQPDLD